MSPLVVIVSGGSRGLGAGIVRRLLDEGHRVAAFSRSQTDFTQGLSRDKDLAGRWHFETVDAADGAALLGFVRSVHARLGRIDALVNNAGVARDGVLALADEADMDLMLAVNVKAALVLAKECSRLMIEQGSGNIINIASIVAERGFSGLSVYAATKAALLGMTRSLARELGPKNIRVNAIAPGYLATEMSQGMTPRQQEQIIRRTPLSRLGSVDDVVPWVSFLLSDESRFVTGQVITIDGGASV